MASPSALNLPENQPFLKRCFSFLCRSFWIVMTRIAYGMHFFEQFYIKLSNIYAFTSQVIFFTLCSLTFEDHHDALDVHYEKYVLMGLKTLLFYSVFTYFVVKTREIWRVNYSRPALNWNFMDNVCRIVLEWAKAVTVVVCLREQGIHFKPGYPYASVTMIYYTSTEKVYTEIVLGLAQFFDFHIFDNLEHLYIPLFLNIYVTALTLFVVLYLLTTKHVMFALLCTYILVYIRSKDIYYNYWRIIQLERRTYDSFKNATAKELEEHDDVCAVCLNSMSRAKITPCNHYFHPLCLKECLKTSFLCPICKLHLTINQ